MPLKYSKSTLLNLEQIFKESDFSVRYEKGNFHSGYCVLHDKKIIVINRFFDLKGRISNLLEILSEVNISENVLSKRSKDLLHIIERSYRRDSKLVA